MTDPLLRPRRRIRESSDHVPAYQPHHGVPIDDEQFKGHGSAFSKILSTNPSTLWNSAQETFSSIPSAFYTGAPVEEEKPSALPYNSSSDSLHVPIAFTMPCRDRTAEFQATAKSIVSRNTYVPPRDKKEAVSQSIQFNQVAKKIGWDLSQTCAKMEKLAEITKRKSVFEDRSEIENLSRIIKEDMTSLNRAIATLQSLSSNGNHSQTQRHTHQVVVGLQSKLANVGKDFQSVLEQRTENLREQKSRREKFSSQADLMPMGLPSSSSTPNVRSRLLPPDEYSGSSSAVALDMGGIQGQAQLSLHDSSMAYAQSRSNTMETIESSISELGQIFSQLAHLVAEQGESIMRIDSNVEETSMNVDAAHSEITKYFHTISQNRWLMIKVFGVLIVFFIIFVMFLT